MNKFFSLLLLFIVISSCDDGGFNAQGAFDFESETMRNCNSGESGFFLFKISGSDALIVQLPETSFVNLVGTTTLNLSASNKVTFRNYDGTLAATDICAVVAPINPIPTTEWIATVGTIEIITTVNKTTNATTNATTITGYTHNISFKNIQFDLGNGTQQLFDEIVFGDYVTSATAFPDFTTSLVKKCGNNFSVLFKNSSNKSLLLQIPESSFPTAPTATPVTLLVNDTNKLSYNLYGTSLTDTSFCLTNLPVPTEAWVAENGVENTSGIIEITTALDVLNTLKHTIVLKKIKLVKEGVDFTLGDAYPYGFIITGL